MNKSKISKLEDKVRRSQGFDNLQTVTKTGDEPYLYRDKQFSTMEEIRKEYGDQNYLVINIEYV